MYSQARSRVRVGDTYSEEFGVKVGVHQGSVLSPLLFLLVLEALSREFRTGCPWELLYADDLVIIAETMEELLEKLKKWKAGLETKGLRVNMSKTKVLISGPELNSLKDSGKFPCAVCRNGVGNNSIYCGGCSHWVHKKCSGVKGKLVPDPEFRCQRCLGNARPIDGRPMKEIIVDGCSPLEVVDSFCYLGDMVSAGGGSELSCITRVKTAWGKFRELLPILTAKCLPLATRGRVYNSCVRSVMLHAGECWAMTKSSLRRLQRNDRAMIRWISNVRLRDQVSSESLLARLEISSLEDRLRLNRLRWFGHVERSDGWINRCRDVQPRREKGPGRPKKTWGECIRNDRIVCGMTKTDPQERVEWRAKLRIAKTRQTPP